MAGPQQAGKSGSGRNAAQGASKAPAGQGSAQRGGAQRGGASRAAGGRGGGQGNPAQGGSRQGGSRQGGSRQGGSGQGAAGRAGAGQGSPRPGSAGRGSGKAGATVAPAARASEPAAVPASRWQRLTGSFGPSGTLKLATFVLSLLGLAVSAYLTYTHFAGIGPAGCSAKSDACVQVQFSPQAEVFGIFPVAVLGLAFFLVMVPMTSPWAWRLPQPAVYLTRLGAVIIGMIFVLYLVYVEIIQIGAICPYCTAVHIMTFLLFGLLVFDAAFRGPGTAASARR